jgi:hypothetical protein
MIKNFVDSKFLLPIDKIYPSMLHFYEIASKKAYFHRYRSLKCECSANSGEPAAGFGLRNQIKFGFILLPKSTAAGLLFCNLQLEHRMMPIVGTQLVFFYIRVEFKNNPDIFAFLFLIAGFKGWQCVKIGEPAAGFGLRNQIKFGFILLPESAAAGLLFGWSLVIGQWGSKVSMGSEALLRHDCMVARDFKNLPEGHHPLNLNLNLNLTLKTRINNSITNYKYRRLSNERS